MGLIKRRLNRVGVIEITLFTILLITFSYTFPRWADPNQNSRLNMVFAVVEDGTFKIDRYVENTVDYARVGDHYYSDKAPGTAFLGIPLYAGLRVILDLPVLEGMVEKLANNEAFKATLREDGSGLLLEKIHFAIAQVVLAFFLAALPTAITGILIFRFLFAFTPGIWPRLIVVIGYSLLTPAFAYANALYGHQLSAALLFGAFYLVFTRQSRLTSGSLLVLGLLLGYSVVTEYPTVLMAVIIFLYSLHTLNRKGDWRKAGWILLSGGIIAAGWMFYNNAIFGGPLNLGYSQSELWTDQHAAGFMSLTTPHWEAIWGITFSAFRGLFLLSPWLLVSLPGFIVWWRAHLNRAEFWVAFTSVLSMFLFNASSIMWWGGFAVGPRYLLPMLPFLVLPTIFVFQKWEASLVLRLSLTALAAWSLAATWGLALAEQAFPSDSIRNPLIEHALPNWLAGNIARNAGTVLGLPGVLSLLPMILILLLVGISGWWLHRQIEVEGMDAGLWVTYPKEMG